MTDIIILPKRRQERGGTAANLAAVNEVLLAREWCVETDTRKVKIGDGVTAWNALPYVGELANLGNPSGDRLVYWDDAANRFAFLSLGTGLAIGSGGDLDVTGGGGDVVGPASSVDGRLALFDGTTGKLLKQGAAPPTGTNTGDQTITLTGDVAGSGTGSFAAAIANDAVTNSKLANMAASTIKARKTASTGDPEDCTLSEILDFIGSAAQGDILYRNASGWARLAAGTSGNFLKTQGAAANPVWAAATATVGIGGSVTSGTTGSLLYVGSGPVLAQDNANLNWNATNSTLGVGAAGGTFRLMVEQTSSANNVPVMAVRNNKTAGTTTPVYVLQISRQNSAVASFYYGSDGNADGVIATNNAQLRIGVDVGGTFTEYAKMTAAGAWTFTSLAGLAVAAAGASAVTPVASIRQNTSGSVAYVLGINRQASATACWYLGADSGDNGLLATNNADLRIGKDVGGTFTEYAKLTASTGVFSFTNVTAGSLNTIAGNLSITNTSGGDGTPVANIRNSRTGTAISVLGVNRQNSTAPALHLGADSSDNAIIAGNGGVDIRIGQFSGATFTEYAKFGTTGKLSFSATNTAAGTTGAQTINKPSGTVNFAAGASSLTVTNSLVSTASIVLCVIRTADATLTSIKSVVPGSGSFAINGNANATGETSVGFVVFN